MFVYVAALLLSAGDPCQALNAIPSQPLTRQVAEATRCRLIENGLRVQPAGPIFVDADSFELLIATDSSLAAQLGSAAWQSTPTVQVASEGPIEVTGNSGRVQGGGIFLRLLDASRTDNGISLLVRSLATYRTRQGTATCPATVRIELENANGIWQIRSVKQHLVC